MAGDLTPEEEAKLIAYLDRQNLEDYDKEFYDELRKIQEPRVAELDDRIRRAIARYIRGVDQNYPEKTQHPRGSFIMEGWILGYMAALETSKSIFKKGRR